MAHQTITLAQRKTLFFLPLTVLILSHSSFDWLMNWPEFGYDKQWQNKWQAVDKSLH